MSGGLHKNIYLCVIGYIYVGVSVSLRRVCILVYMDMCTRVRMTSRKIDEPVKSSKNSGKRCIFNVVCQTQPFDAKALKEGW